MPKGRQPRGVTPRPRSGAAAESARLQWRRNSGEDLSSVLIDSKLTSLKPYFPPFVLSLESSLYKG